MRTFAQISLAVEEITVDAQRLVRIQVVPESLRDWCLCLQLLHDGLVEMFTFRRAFSSKTVQVARSERNRSGAGGDTDGLRLTLSARDLDFARHFFLRYYRDGAAEVDHIDIETGDGGYITLAVQESIPPVSSEEAKRRLGL